MFIFNLFSWQYRFGLPDHVGSISIIFHTRRAGEPASKPAYRTRTRPPHIGSNGAWEHHGSVAAGTGRGRGGRPRGRRGRASKPAYRARTRPPHIGSNGAWEHHGSVAAGTGRASGAVPGGTGGTAPLA